VERPVSREARAALPGSVRRRCSDRAEIDPLVFNGLLSGDQDAEVPQEVLDRISAVTFECSPVVLRGADGEVLDVGRSGGSASPGAGDGTTGDGTTGGGAPAAEPPVIVVADDGSAEVNWVPSTDLVRVDPEIPMLASNR
jgi:hypothetical protein